MPEMDVGNMDAGNEAGNMDDAGNLDAGNMDDVGNLDIGNMDVRNDARNG